MSSAQPQRDGGGLWCERLFNPRAIAIVGAGQRATSMGARYLRNLRSYGFAGPSYAVSHRPGADGYEHVSDIPGPVDLCQVAAPFAAVPKIVSDCAAAGVAVVQILTAPDGSISQDEITRWESQIRRAIQGRATRVVGPNCVGTHAPHARVTFLAAASPVEGGVSLVSQSGGLTADFVAQAEAWGVGLRNVVSVGNCLDAQFHEYVGYFADDPETTTIGLYLEGTSRGRDLLHAIAEAATKKPVFVLKGGASQLGQRAAATHTGSLAGEFRTWRALLVEHGAVMVESPDELLFALSAGSDVSVLQSPHVALVGNGGGMTVLLSDELDRAGLDLIELGEEHQQRVDRLPPPAGATFGSATDVPGGALSRNPTVLQSLIEALAEDPDLGGFFAHFNLVALAAYENQDELVGGLITALQTAHRHRPVYLGLRATGEAKVELLRRRLVRAARESGIPSFPGGEVAIRAAARALAADRSRSVAALQVDAFGGSRPETSTSSAAWVDLDWRGSGAVETLASEDAQRVLHGLGIRYPSSRRARSTEQALAVARTLGFPVVAKLDSPDIIHKTDAGGVRVGIATEFELESVCRSWNLDACVSRGIYEAVLLQEQVPPGVEVLLGARHDTTFGPTLVVGVGGVLTELVDDVTVIKAPTSGDILRGILRGSRLQRLLEGYRGRPQADLEGLIDIVVRFAEVAVQLPSEIEIEFNPLIVGGTGTAPVAVDVRVIRQAVRTPPARSRDVAAV